MPAAGCRRVYILGAGFSKAAGLPLATELTDLVVERFRGTRDPDLEGTAFADRVRALHRWIHQHQQPRPSPLNIEEFYEYAHWFAEGSMLEQHCETVGREAGFVASREAEDIHSWLHRCDEVLFQLLLEREERADTASTDRFVDALRVSDVVLTFNYDRLVEQRLSHREKERKVSFGFPTCPPGGQRVLKLHGSLDWLQIPRHDSRQYETVELFRKRDENVEIGFKRLGGNPEPEYDFTLHRVTGQEALRQILSPRKIDACGFRRGWAGLGLGKSPSSVAGLGVVWLQASRALYDAEEIVVVGFSFASFDRLAQVRFADVMAARAKGGVPRPRVAIVDPGLGSDPELEARILAVFAEIDEKLALKHQEIEDWHAVLNHVP